MLLALLVPEEVLEEPVGRVGMVGRTRVGVLVVGTGVVVVVGADVGGEVGDWVPVGVGVTVEELVGLPERVGREVGRRMSRDGEITVDRVEVRLRGVPGAGGGVSNVVGVAAETGAPGDGDWCWVATGGASNTRPRVTWPSWCSTGIWVLVIAAAIPLTDSVPARTATAAPTRTPLRRVRA